MLFMHIICNEEFQSNYSSSQKLPEANSGSLLQAGHLITVFFLHCSPTSTPNEIVFESAAVGTNMNMHIPFMCDGD